jgi:hypothetical protein
LISHKRQKKTQKGRGGFPFVVFVPSAANLYRHQSQNSSFNANWICREVVAVAVIT